MEIKTKRDGNTAVVAVSGRLDAVTAEEYQCAVRVLVETGTTCVVVDLAELTYISSVGMGTLVLTAKWLREKGGQFGIASLRESVQTVIERCGLAALLGIYPSVPQALAATA